MIFFVTSSGTDVGKSVASAVIYRSLTEAGYKTALYKPFQSGLTEGTPADSHYYNKMKIPVHTTYTFEEPLSPHLAAKRAGILPDINKVLDTAQELASNYDIVLIEGAGGIHVPLIQDDHYVMTTDLIRMTNAHVIGVIPAQLGGINQAMMLHSSLVHFKCKIAMYVMTPYIHHHLTEDNYNVLKNFNLPVVKLPFFEQTAEGLSSIIQHTDIKEHLNAYISGKRHTAI